MSNDIAIEKRALTVIEQAKTFLVLTPDDLEAANGLRKIIKGMAAEVELNFGPIVDYAYATWKEATVKRAKYLDPLKEADKRVKGQMETYVFEHEQKAKAEQARLQAEADEKARKEREKLEAQAAKAEASGKAEKAEALKEQAAAVTAFAPTVEPVAPKIAGQSYRDDWDIEVIDVNLIPREYMTVNTALIQKDVRNWKGQKQIPGVKIIPCKIAVTRR